MQINKALDDIKRGLGLHNIWVSQAYHEITAKYKRTFLGPFWTVGQMVTMSIALSLMIGSLMGNDPKEALPFVMSGMIAWGLVSYMWGEGVEIFFMNAGTIKNHAYPFSYYILEANFRNLILFAHNLVVYFVFMAILGAFVIPSWTIIFGVIVVAINAIFWSAMTTMAAARYRDLRYLLPYVGQIVYFLTPVFWKPLPGKKSALRSIFIENNPLSALVEIIRKPLMGQYATLHEWYLVGAITIIGAVSFFFSFASFRRRIAFWV